MKGFSGSSGSMIDEGSDSGGGGAGFVGGLISAGASIYNSERNIANAQALNRSAQKFAKHMSSTAHTREVADLRNAGLNPILSATGGQGASTPSPNLQMGQSEFDLDGLRQGAVTAAELRRIDKEIEQKDADIDLAKAAKTREEAVAEFNRANSKTIDATRPAVVAEAKNREKGAKAVQSIAGPAAVAERVLGVFNNIPFIGRK